MTHLVLIEDKTGDLVDLNYYCSDSCARTDKNYAGWYGCYELTTPENCNACGVALSHVSEFCECVTCGESQDGPNFNPFSRECETCETL